MAWVIAIPDGFRNGDASCGDGERSMQIFRDKAAAFRQLNRAAGVGALLAAGVLLYRGQLPFGFVVAFFGLSAIVMAESEIDPTQQHTMRSLGRSLAGRSYVSTLGKLCDIASWFCLAAALISWFALR
jgi:hypothetical protein